MVDTKEKYSKDGWISFKEQAPKSGQLIWILESAGSYELQEKAIFNSDNTLELVLPEYKITSLITNPTHWKECV